MQRTSQTLRFPVLSEGAEHLVMGNLMKRNILTYKAPPMNEGYDLICIHPDPSIIQGSEGITSQVRVQVKSRYASDCDKGFPIKEEKLDTFDFLIAVFLNIGNYYKGDKNGDDGYGQTEFYTLSRDFIKNHHNPNSSWQKVRLKDVMDDIQQYRDEKGFELIASKLGISPLTRKNWS
jgi:hypothetical protein|tara:strand:- start:365 stop:895 length:531 start_codon:yes stop_codon:yes gene_type:complete